MKLSAVNIIIPLNMERAIPNSAGPSNSIAGVLCFLKKIYQVVKPAIPYSVGNSISLSCVFIEFGAGCRIRPRSAAPKLRLRKQVFKSKFPCDEPPARLTYEGFHHRFKT